MCTCPFEKRPSMCGNYIWLCAKHGAGKQTNTNYAGQQKLPRKPTISGLFYLFNFNDSHTTELGGGSFPLPAHVSALDYSLASDSQ